ncbi:MAG: MBL fold metallo-hydrolase [Chloroflexota bacterium]
MPNSKPEVTTLVLGPLQTNCYLVVCPTTREALVIDPADSANRILEAARDRNASITRIVLTHTHSDHVGGLPALRQATRAQLLAHRLDAEMIQQHGRFYGLRDQQISQLLPDVRLEGGEEITVGQLTMKVHHTPGHTPGGITLQLDGLLFTGDTLFAQGVGRVDLPGGSLDQLLASIQQLFTLPDESVDSPGHGPTSTIGTEKRDTPYV